MRNTTTTALGLLLQAPMFKELPKARLRTLASDMRELRFVPDKTIFARGDPARDIYVVAEGRVRLSVLSPDGRVLTFKHAGEGDLFGEIGAFDGGVRTADATASTRVRVFALDRDLVITALTGHPEAARAAIDFLCERLRITSAQMEDIALHSIVERIARFLLSALRLSGTRHTAGHTASLDLQLSQAELADLLGASRQRTNIALARLKKNGALTQRNNLYLCNVEKLREIAHPD